VLRFACLLYLEETLQMNTTEPITTILFRDGRYYANINGITKGSIGCYFNDEGKLTASTLDNFKGSKYHELTEKLLAEISRRGVIITKAEN
jgi:hypothetical protein